ncbi:MAG TPA: NUDIX domain-containing protein [Candidatus Sulfotelmatobacter sp.]|nr:NUDIX domain-containing protein [Candidatus Sulfotelmatobacter sp.]
MQPEPDATKATKLRTAVSAIIMDRDGRILLQRRSDNGRWGVPGGGVEIGENVRDAVVREIQEETGLSVEVVRLVGVYSDPTFQVVRYPDGNVVHYVSLFFQCRILGGELATCDETLELGFFDPQSLPENVLHMHRIRIQDALAETPAAFIR